MLQIIFGGNRDLSVDRSYSVLVLLKSVDTGLCSEWARLTRCRSCGLVRIRIVHPLQICQLNASLNLEAALTNPNRPHEALRSLNS